MGGEFWNILPFPSLNLCQNVACWDAILYWLQMECEADTELYYDLVGSCITLFDSHCNAILAATLRSGFGFIKVR